MDGRESSDMGELIAALMLLTKDERREWAAFSARLHETRKERQRDQLQTYGHPD